jgi:GDPmannose 4,6-dehydratase
MWRILQCPEPDDYVLATGETHSVREFVEKAFAQIGVKIVWQGAGVDEKGLDPTSGRILVQVDPRYFRPTEVDLLIGDPSRSCQDRVFRSLAGGCGGSCVRTASSGKLPG